MKSPLLQHNWPGNVRELAGMLETALLEAAHGVIRHRVQYVLDLNRGNKLRTARRLQIGRTALQIT